MNDTATHRLFGAPHGPDDPETGLPTIEVTPDLAVALTAAGWHRDPANIEGQYVEGDWVINNVTGPGPVLRSYSIEPSGHHRSVIVHRGPVCDCPVFAINVQGGDPLNPSVVLAAVTALIADDLAEDAINAGLPQGSLPDPPFGQPCWVTMGPGFPWLIAERVEIAGDTYWQELRSTGNRTLDIRYWLPLGPTPAPIPEPEDAR